MIEKMFNGLWKFTKADKKRMTFKELTAQGLKDNPLHLTRKIIRGLIRKAIRNNLNTAPSQFAGLPSRRERRVLAKLDGVMFTPLYNN